MLNLKYKYIPNLITVFRLVLLIPISFLFVYGWFYSLFILFSLAAISDALDGWLARRYQWKTYIGSILDPLADKMLMLVSYSGLAYIQKIPIWFLIMIVFRDIWIMGGVLIFRLCIAPLHFEPTKISKINTIFQLLFVWLTLVDAQFNFVPYIICQILMFLVLSTTAASFIDYTYQGIKRAIYVSKAKRHVVK